MVTGGQRAGRGLWWCPCSSAAWHCVWCGFSRGVQCGAWCVDEWSVVQWEAHIVCSISQCAVPALQKRHDVTCHCYRYLSHPADVTCRLLTLPTVTLCSICTCGTWKFTKMATSEIVCSFQCCIVKLLCHECSFLDTPLFIKAVGNTCPLV